MTLLVSLDEYKEFEAINGSNDDDKYTKLVTSVSALVKTYCNSSLIDNHTSVRTEFFDIQWDTNIVQLQKTPIIDNANFKVYERANQILSYVQLYRDGGGSPAGYDFYLDPLTDAVFRTDYTGGYINFPKGVKSVKVEYNYGYATTPEDLKLAVVDLITYYAKKEHKPRMSLGSATVQNKAVTAEALEIGFPEHIQRILDMYKVHQ